MDHEDEGFQKTPQSDEQSSLEGLLFSTYKSILEFNGEHTSCDFPPEKFVCAGMEETLERLQNRLGSDDPEIIQFLGERIASTIVPALNAQSPANARDENKRRKKLVEALEPLVPQVAELFGGEKPTNIPQNEGQVWEPGYPGIIEASDTRGPPIPEVVEYSEDIPKKMGVPQVEDIDWQLETSRFHQKNNDWPVGLLPANALQTILDVLKDASNRFDHRSVQRGSQDWRLNSFVMDMARVLELHFGGQHQQKDQYNAACNLAQHFFEKTDLDPAQFRRKKKTSPKS